MTGPSYQYGTHYGSAGDTGDKLPITEGNVLWIDGQDTSTFTEVSGNLDMWRDKSGFGHSADADSSIRRPVVVSSGINGHQSVLFNGTVNGLTINTGVQLFDDLTQLTVFLVVDYEGGGGIEISFAINNNQGGNTGATSGFRFEFDDNISNFHARDAGGEKVTSFVHDKGLNLFTGRIDGTNLEYRVDGVLVDSVPFAGLLNGTAFVDVRLGHTFGSVGGRLDGFFGEVIVYDRALSEFELQQLYLYLNDKWGLNITIAAPLTVENSVLWLDGQDASTLTVDVDGFVSQWKDKSEEGHDVVQGTAANQPLVIQDVVNGFPGVEFDGQDDYLRNASFSAFNEISVFVVGMYRDSSDTAQDENMLGISDGINPEILISREARSTIFESFFLLEERLNGPLVFDKVQIHNGIYNGILSQYFIDGALRGGKTLGPFSIVSSTLTLGSNLTLLDNLRGPIGEIIIYDRALTVSERIFITNYLASKWGINVFNNDIPGSLIWLDAVDETARIDSGSEITLLRDKSGLNNEVFQNAESKKPDITLEEAEGAINKLPTLIFDGVEDSLQNVLPLPDITGLTVITVLRYDFASLPDDTAISLHSSVNDSHVQLTYLDGDSSAFQYNNTDIPQNFTLAHVESPQLHIYTAMVKPTELEYYLENSLIAVQSIIPTVTPLNNIILGDSASFTFPFQGAIGEVLVFNKELNVADRSTINTYLAEKWGIMKPTLLLNNILWLDATDTTTISEIDGAVSEWRDKSGKNNHVTQSTESKKPNSQLININGLPAIKFDRVDDNLVNTSFPNLDTFSIFIVVEYTDIGAQGQQSLSVSNATEAGTGVDFFYNDTSLSSFVAVRDSAEFVRLVFLDESPKLRIYAAILDGVNLKYYVNNVLQDTGVSGPVFDTLTTLTLGSTVDDDSFLEGYIGEVIIYDRAIADLERNLLFDSLGEKWGILDISRIQGNTAWYDAADDTTITVDIDGFVSQWSDKSTSGNDLVQGTGAEQPNSQSHIINGLPAIKFDGVDDTLRNITFPDLSKFSVFVVAQYDAGGANQTILEISTVIQDEGVNFHYDDASNSSRVLVFDGVEKIVSKVEDPKLHLYAGTLDGATLRYYIDDPASPVDTISSNILSNTVPFLSVGALVDVTANPFKGTVGEIIIFNREVSDTERRTIFNYLTRKWKILDVPSLAGIVAQYDATNFESLNLSLSAVMEWKDSANANDLEQLVGVNQPAHSLNIINGLPAVVFDGVDDTLENMTFPDLNTVLICVVAEYFADSGTQTILDINDGSTLNGGALFRYIGSLSSFLGFDGTLKTLTFMENESLHIYTGIINGTDIEYYLDGDLKDSAVGFGTLTTVLSEIVLGTDVTGGRLLEGAIGEIVIVTDTTQRAVIENYLSNKWRIALK